MLVGGATVAILLLGSGTAALGASADHLLDASTDGALSSAAPLNDSELSACTPSGSVKESIETVPEAKDYAGASLVATVVTQDFNGNVTTQRLPPSEWVPANATPEELAYFHIDPKPTDKAGLAEWMDG